MKRILNIETIKYLGLSLNIYGMINSENISFFVGVGLIISSVIILEVVKNEDI